MDRRLFLFGIDDEQRLGHTLHRDDTVKDLFEFGQFLERSVLFLSLDLFQAVDAFFYGGKVSKHATWPPLGNIMHAATQGLPQNHFLSLFFGADEHDEFALCGDFHQKVLYPRQALFGLFEVNNVNTASFTEYEFFHFGIPAGCPVSEVNSGFEQRFDKI